WPNALRAILTEEAAQPTLETDAVTLLECNVDDMSAEVFPYVIERLLEHGALDAWTTPVTMKKGRPATVLSVLTRAGEEERFADILLRETTTLGVRYVPWRRFKAGRDVRTVRTQWGEVRVKQKLLDGEVTDAAPEYEDCARLAREHDVPLRAVYEAAAHAARHPKAIPLSG
ncbi:MAG: LarC family nickel insertion protein, partial [Chloroflexia bacterium]|nr:LarC family nickel insertion protein [Chloroflexia bacterium]